MTTKTRIVLISNSRGIRVPKPRLVVRAAERPRAGCESKARAMHGRDEDELLDDPTATRFDESDWQWCRRRRLT